MADKVYIDIVIQMFSFYFYFNNLFMVCVTFLLIIYNLLLFFKHNLIINYFKHNKIQRLKQ